MGLEILILDQVTRMRPKSWHFLPKLPNYVNERSLRWIDLAGIIPSTPNILLKACEDDTNKFEPRVGLGLLKKPFPGQPSPAC
ncbi:hypothetical protein TNCV_4028461 [Trichonephila clavipes]|nr:hypothetical protein TNCV_4028461 [Trichonephila clavipes]